MTRRGPWYESDNPDRVGGALTVRWIALVVIVALVAGGLAIAHWGFGVLTADARGAGDARRRIASGTNRIGSQEHFESLYGEIRAADRNLDQAAADKRDHPGDAIFATAYSGLVKHCNDVVATYNADARKVSREQWRSPDLPQRIDAADPETDCKESTP